MEQEEACSSSSSTTLMRQCRICHDEEDQGGATTMESPCGCSGSLKVWIPASLGRELLDAPLFCFVADALSYLGLTTRLHHA